MGATQLIRGVVIVAVLAAGCASSRRHELAVQDLQAQVGVLESRVSAIDERQQTLEQQARQERKAAAALSRQAVTAPPRASAKVVAPKQVKKTRTKTKTKTQATTAPAATNRGYLYKQPKVSISTRAIQRALKRAGYYTGRIDGVIGPRTKKSVRAFQQANGLKPDGIVGQQTWAKLQEHLPSASGSK